MEHLATLPPFVAQRLVDQLHEAGVPAEATDSPLGDGGWLPGLGGSGMTVWLLNAEDLEVGRRILKSLQDVPEESEHCDSCGYDLRGHAGEKVCPECGEKVLVNDPQAWWTCAKCGEESPPTANSCWKCAAPEVQEPASELVGPTPNQQQRSNRIVFTIVVIAVLGMLIMFFNRVVTEWF